MPVFWVFFPILSYQNPKFHTKLALCGKNNDITRKVSFECFLSVLGNKALKSRVITLHGNKNNFYQELAFKCFELITYQNAKTHAKHLLWKNRITLSKTYILRVLIMLPIKTLKYIQRTVFLGNERTLRETCMSVL